MNNFINSIARNGLSKNAYLFGLVSTFLVSPFVSLWFIIYGMRRNEYVNPFQYPILIFLFVVICSYILSIAITMPYNIIRKRIESLFT